VLASHKAGRRETEEGGTRCAVHIAETDELTFSRRCTVATVRTVTVDVLTAVPVSVRRKGQCVGAAWSENGRVPAPRETDGRDIGLLHYAEGAKWSPADWISNRVMFGAM